MRPARSTKEVPRQLGLHRETLFQKSKKEKKRNKKRIHTQRNTHIEWEIEREIERITHRCTFKNRKNKCTDMYAETKMYKYTNTFNDLKNNRNISEYGNTTPYTEKNKKEWERWGII